MNRLAILAVPAALLLAACADGKLALPTPGAVFGKQAEYVAQFCAPEFVEQPVDAASEWVGLFNLLTPVTGLDPIDAGKYTESELTTNLLAARAAVCVTYGDA